MKTRLFVLSFVALFTLDAEGPLKNCLRFPPGSSWSIPEKP